MSIYAIGDLHLSLGGDKPMDIFGGWDDYLPRLEKNWRALVEEDDTVVIPGDISWAMRLEDTAADFAFLDSLPGRKLLMKGNHDYWWSTRAKADVFFAARGLKTLEILHNNAVMAGELLLCGSRGWLFENGAPHDQKIVRREAMRIEASLQEAEKLDESREKVLFLHYPPIYREQQIPEFLELMTRYRVRRCYYGHLHGPSIGAAFQGSLMGIDFRLISADALRFAPLRVW